MTTLVQTGASDKTGVYSILVALAFGFALVLSVGFASADTLHDAAHDMRHATGFPCH